MSAALQNRRILVIEDDMFIALELEMALQAEEAIVLGPVPKVRAGLELVEQEPEICAAILDVNVGGETVFPIADALRERSVPFVFATGEALSAIPPRFAGVKVFQKPVGSPDLVRGITELLPA